MGTFLHWLLPCASRFFKFISDKIACCLTRSKAQLDCLIRALRQCSPYGATARYVY